MEEREKLDPMQEKFCVEYVNDPRRNQTQAALRAGYAEKSAYAQASRLMKHVKVRRRIRELEREALEEAGYSPDSIRALVIRKLVAQVSVDSSDIVKIVYPDDANRDKAIEQAADMDDGQYRLDFGEPMVYVRPTSDWTPDEYAAVKAVRQTRDGIEVVTYDHQAAIKLLADITGITKTGIDVNLSVADELTDARARAAEAVSE